MWHRRIAWKVQYQLQLVPCEFFSMELENAVGIYDKMQVVYKEMTSDIVKNYTSNPLEPIISH